MREEINRLRLKYENDFNSASTKIKSFQEEKEELKKKENYYLNQIEFLQSKAEN